MNISQDSKILFFAGWYNMKVGERQQQGRKGAKPKTVCPKCEKEYLKTSFGTEIKKFVRVGQYCPNPACDYMIKDYYAELGEESPEGTDKAEKIKRLTAEFVKTHERLNELAKLIHELETE